jgi:hypothetical protein
MLQQLIQERPDDSLEKIFFGGEKSPSAPSKRFIVVSGTLPDRELDPRPMLGIRFLAALTHQCCTVISAKRVSHGHAREAQQARRLHRTHCDRIWHPSAITPANAVSTPPCMPRLKSARALIAAMMMVPQRYCSWQKSFVVLFARGRECGVGRLLRDNGISFSRLC